MKIPCLVNVLCIGTKSLTPIVMPSGSRNKTLYHSKLPMWELRLDSDSASFYLEQTFVTNEVEGVPIGKFLGL